MKNQNQTLEELEKEFQQILSGEKKKLNIAELNQQLEDDLKAENLKEKELRKALKASKKEQKQLLRAGDKFRKYKGKNTKSNLLEFKERGHKEHEPEFKETKLLNNTFQVSEYINKNILNLKVQRE
jgi:hypothetical protein